jgi:hypothetical protein
VAKGVGRALVGVLEDIAANPFASVGPLGKPMRGTGRGVGPVFRLEFEAAPYHGATARGGKSAGPINGQDALDYSLQVKGTSPRRVGIDYETGDFVVFDRTGGNKFHGHVRTWSELSQEQRNTLIDAGMVNRRGQRVMQ